ncbi:DNA polymerase I [Roseofilum casamattae]|uniref:DNA polymerase I n=1 Tax=Roseofilum casamattae BLCC-M143 TaxID=3022442 RepID=A0ABT7C162_9CYAN|nr:DNA polymerase I [Roseofilum casamattae]MDJ1185176.1 DNA polymerase I [Roseofilum casamattae BLCC-M143]
MASSAPQPLLLLIDGHSLAFRSYYAFAKSRDGGLKTRTGIPTSICFGFLKALFEVLSQQTPQALAIAFDRGKETFRHQADPNYKANREETPDDFVPDIENLQQILAALQIPIASSAGYEADDILATLAERGAAAGYRVKILTGDRDLFQLVNAEKLISVLYLRGGSQNRDNTAYEYDPIQVQEKMGVTPEQVVDYKALCGDASDNIPGVRGIGEKTAVKLLQEYGTLDGVYRAIDSIKGAMQKKLVAGKEDAYHSQFLAQIIRDVELELPLEKCKLQGFDAQEVSPLFASLELQTFSKKLDKLQELFGGEVPTKPEALAIAEQESEELFFWTAKDTEAAQKEKELPFVPEVINTPDKLTDLVERLQACTDAVAWDTETTDLDPRIAKLVGVGCCFAEGKDKEPTVAYLPLNHQDGKNLDCDRAIDLLRPLLEDSNSTKIFQNAKFDRLIFQNYGITLQGRIFDTLLASYILNPDSAHNLSALAQQELGIISQSYTELVPKGKTIADIDISLVAGYCGMDVYAAFHLCDRFQQKLANFPKLEQLLTEIELPLEPVLAKMEWTGIRIDSDYLNSLSEQLAKQLETIKTKAHKIAGDEFNLGSPKQVSSILFEKLQLPTRKSRKIKTGYSTDAATLEKLQSDDTTGVVRAILDYRTLDKLKSTYVDALPQLVHPQTQRVHTDFNQAVTSTGRLSSSNPNLQNIPIRTEFSRQIRKAFIPETGWILSAADYSQIELRILAHLSGEPTLIDAYQNQRDIHAVTAQLLFDREEITPEERRLGKVINFGVIYGMGAQRFAREAGVSAIEGKEFIDRFNRQYPQVFAYLEQVKHEAIAQGYVETIFGRRRYFQFESLELKKQFGKPANEISLQGIRLGRNDAGLLRAAANAPIQGSSADLIKIAMVKLDKVLENYQGRLLLQVHDELVLEMPENEWEQLSSDIKTTMESAAVLNVPLVADIHQGKSWMSAK